jgi:hypothetical protein
MPSFRLVLCALAVITGSSLSNAANPFWQQFANQPVFVEQNNNGNKQILKFTGYSDNMLQAELSLRNPDGSTSTAEISLPVSETMAQTLKFTLKNKEKSKQLIDQGNLVGALDLLRPDVYPLVKYSRLPEIFVDLHTPVRTLLKTLINAGEYAEAEDLFGRMQLGKIGLSYSDSAVRLMNAYLIANDAAAAARVAQMLPFDGEYVSNIAPVLLAADTIRSAGLYEAVIPLYRSIRPNAIPEEQKRVDLWLAYSLVLADRIEEATLVIDSLEEPAPSEELFSLYKLLEGSRAYRKGDYGLALDTLTRGFVRAQTSYSWVPEMLYRIGDCYARAEDPIAARNVWSEITLLYPESNWYQPASDAINALPQQETLAE